MPQRIPGSRRTSSLALTEREIDNLVALLASLTSPEYRKSGLQQPERQRTPTPPRTSRPQLDDKRAFGPKRLKPKPPRLSRGAAYERA